MSALPVLAQVQEEDIGGGPFGLVIILVLLIATFLLVRNMSGRIKRLPREFPEQEPTEAESPDPRD
jgi:hypothetical protein